MAKKKSAEITHERYNLQDQTKAYLFVGKFISDFAGLEETIHQAIISYFLIDSTLSENRKNEIFEKNTSTSEILEFSVLGSKNFSVQMKIEMIKAIIQKRDSQFYATHGIRLFALIDLFQKLRNQLAHNKTYVYNKELFIARPTVDTKPIKQGTLKGGVIPDPIGKYEVSYTKQIITDEISDKISTQIGIAKNIISYYTISKTQPIFDISHAENLLKIDSIFTGGVYDIEMLK